ncbi:hypothetical protein KFE96_10545 [Kordiimonas sp. SCSIO 12603]|uniref:hypothetical protein n=1 Tax=Kordiimonas sp. SCSIO 12603 TaxID=2829596 RepID=UPI002105FE27|nr:hypothetical protein [Kordiimonas sp. SCSIO 12603]UTW57295.1 hypothetical protein KFE96_10545 [Kordiimonas sp. SCSIO 12603]
MSIKTCSMIVSGLLCVAFTFEVFSSDDNVVNTVTVSKFYSSGALIAKSSGEVGIDYWQKTSQPKALYEKLTQTSETSVFRGYFENILNARAAEVTLQDVPEVFLYPSSNEVQFIADATVSNLWSKEGDLYVFKVKPDLILHEISKLTNSSIEETMLFSSISETAVMHLPIGWVLDDAYLESKGDLFDFTMKGETKKDTYVVNFKYVRHSQEVSPANLKASALQFSEIRDNGFYQIWEEGAKSEIKFKRPTINLKLEKKAKELKHRAPPGYRNEKEKKKPSH